MDPQLVHIQQVTNACKSKWDKLTFLSLSLQDQSIKNMYFFKVSLSGTGFSQFWFHADTPNTALIESHTYFLQSYKVVIIFTQLHRGKVGSEGKF